MKKLVTYISVSAIIITSGCKKDMLEISNPNSITTDNFWKTGDDAIAGVNAIYSTLHRGGISRWQWFYYEIRSDIGTSTSPATDIINNMDIFNINDYNYGNTVGVYADNYIGINRANQVLDNVPSIDMDENLKKRILGEAHFMRALFYYHLATLFGNVPLILESNNPEFIPGNTPQSQVFDQIIIDLNEAVSLLPKKSEYSSEDLGRATKGAAQALLAKTHMQKGEYQLAITPLAWFFSGDGAGEYSLMPNYRDNFLITSENNAESVFEWQFEINTTETNDNDIEPNHNYGTSISKFLSPKPVGFADGEALRWVVDEFKQDLTTGGSRDPRLAASFLFDSTNVNGPTQTDVYGQTWQTRKNSGTLAEGVFFHKFLNDHWRNTESFRSNNNYRQIRFADIMLLYAECLNATGATGQSYQYVDMVRERAGLAALSVTKPGLGPDAFLEQLKHERITELSGEGHRFTDLIRWGDLSTQVRVNKVALRDPAFNNFEIDKHELLPIPQLDLDQNNNLDQNPGY